MKNISKIVIIPLVAAAAFLSLNAFGLKINGQLERAILEKVAATPAPLEGRIFYNTTSKKMGIYNGTSWQEYAPADDAVLRSVGTAKGDLIGFTGAGAPTPIPSATNGLFLTTDSTEATGVKWGAVPEDTAHIRKDIGAEKGQLIGFSGAAAPTPVPTPASDGLVLTSSTAAATGVAWSAIPEDTNHIRKDLGTAKGDIIGFTDAGAPTPLPSATNGLFLTTDSTQATGIKWGPVPEDTAHIRKDVGTEKGQLIGFSAAATPTPIPTGADGYVLTAKASAGTGVEWAAIPAAGVTVVSKAYVDTPYTAAINEYIVYDASGGSSTINLPTAVGNAGKYIRIKRSDADFAKTLTIDGNSSETIGGSATKILYTQNEEVTLISDNANWIVSNHQTNMEAIAVTMTTGMTNGGGAVNITAAYMARSGDKATFWGKIVFHATNNPVFTGGSMTLILPTGVAMDTAKISGVSYGDLGLTTFIDTGTEQYAGYLRYSDTNTLLFMTRGSNNAYVDSGSMSTTGPHTWANGDIITFNFTVAVTGWWQ